MHPNSLPPSDRDEAPETHKVIDEALRAQLEAVRKEPGMSNSIIGKGVGRSDSAISTYLSRKYVGDIAGLQAAIREWLRDRTVMIGSGIATVKTEISKELWERFEEIRKDADLGLIVGPAGIGKSRGLSLYMVEHSLAIAFRALPWRRAMRDVGRDVASAAEILRTGKGEGLWEAIIDRTKGSGRLLIVDDAHELSPTALQCCVDYHDKTGNPVVLLGLASLKARLLKDARRARRVGRVHELKLTNHKGELVKERIEPLLEHMIEQIAPAVNGERPELLKLCQAVAMHTGAFGAVEKQLKYAARMVRKKPSQSWVGAFHHGHNRLLRNYALAV